MPCSPKGANDRRINQYYKITLLDSITKDLEKLADIQVSNQYNPEGPFEQIVDLENPHQSLQGLMGNSETCFAKVVEALLNKNVSMDTIKKLVYKKGQEIAVDSNNLEEVYTYLIGTILDGMPCDETKDIIENNDKKLVYRKLIDMHSKYWKDEEAYYQLLTSFIEGILSKTSIHYSDQGHSIFTLSK